MQDHIEIKQEVKDGVTLPVRGEGMLGEQQESAADIPELFLERYSRAICTRWHTPTVPDTQEQTGGSFEPRSLGPTCTTQTSHFLKKRLSRTC
jgi:hypothetical protein